MASIIERNGRFRALVRRSRLSRCATFPTKQQARHWVRTQERELAALRSTGLLPTNGITLADLIDRYEREVYPLKAWGRSKSVALKRLRKDCGDWPAGRLTSHKILTYMDKRRRSGAQAATLAGVESTLFTVLQTARGLWTLDVPIEAAKEARQAMRQSCLVGKSKRRDRRVTDKEFAAVIGYFDSRTTSVPMRDILEFCMATGMRISEVCQLRWDDLDLETRTILIRDRKHPTDRIGNDQKVPLLDATGFDALAIAI